MYIYLHVYTYIYTHTGMSSFLTCDPVHTVQCNDAES